MNISDYISSGILESYVLGTATNEERAEVEKYAALYPEIKAELEEIENAIGQYATEHSVQPPSYLKEKIVINITGNKASPVTAKEPVIRTLNQSAKPAFWSIAATVLILVSTSFAVYFAVKVNKMDSDMDTVSQANTELTDSLKALTSNITQMQSDLAVLKDPMYKIVELKGLKVAPQAKAMVCWCPEDKKVYVEIDNLPPTPQGMQYQLWAIVDGKPVSEGMLTMGNGLHPMKDVENAQAFAVTLEKAGGSPTPNMDAMYVMGTI